MKRLYLLMALLMAFTAPALALDPCYTGAWGDPDRDGEGITISVLDDGRTLAYMYAFGSEGRAWYVMTSRPDGALTMFGALKTSEDPYNANTHNVGDATITPIDGDTIEFTYSLRLDIDRKNATIPWCSNNLCEGSYTYTRIYGAGACN